LVAAISKIKEAEDANEALLVKATETAQEITRAAAASARDRTKAIRDETREKRAEILSKARSDADAACAPLKESAEREIERVLHPNENAFESAVNALVKKLVG